MSDDSKEMVLSLKVKISVHCGETEEDVAKHLLTILYDKDSDIQDIEWSVADGEVCS